ncbi:MAG: phosphatase PAP2 family protein [Deltaproteobacteria bacterium]|nr:phosphatase PAP2 family protein [Deltaproteobacteria bacterium]
MIRKFLVLIFCCHFFLAGHSTPILAENSALNVPPLLEFLPPPPGQGEIDADRDIAIYRATRAERGGGRWEQAVFDAADKERLEVLFLDSFGLKINRETTPATLDLLSLVTGYMAKTINPAKDHYKRVRPFVYFEAPGSTCAPGDEEALLDNGSYPSGHSSRGWGLALVLAVISPERQGAILKRGYELGESRVICGVHWQSDVESARLGASVAVLQLHNAPEFLRLLEEARMEIGRLRSAAAAPVAKLRQEAPVDSGIPADFVRVTDLAPEVLLDIRYYSAYNFVGTRVDGYQAPAAFLARPAAQALARAAEAAEARGYILKIFDAYRPQSAVDHFVRWVADMKDQKNKAIFYPAVDKGHLFEKNYIAARSGHSRGAAVDLTLVERSTGQELDMGTPFDFFGVKSHHAAAGLTRIQAANRKELSSIMEAAGFRPYAEEWWHYSLADEPHPDTYFNFPVQP